MAKKMFLVVVMVKILMVMVNMLMVMVMVKILMVKMLMVMMQILGAECLRRPWAAHKGHHDVSNRG